MFNVSVIKRDGGFVSLSWDFLYPNVENYTNYMLLRLNLEEDVMGSAYYDNVRHFKSIL